ncbi:hypothetical protein AHAS_AhasUnG0036600 [Arachis hypogaea]
MVDSDPHEIKDIVVDERVEEAQWVYAELVGKELCLCSRNSYLSSTNVATCNELNITCTLLMGL